MRRAAAGLDFSVDGARDFVAWQQVWGTAVLLVLVPRVRLLLGLRGLCTEELGDVVEHEPSSLRVQKRSPITPYAFGHQNPAHTRWPDHASRMELDHLHVDQVGAGVECHRHAVAGAFPRIGGDLPGLARATSRQHDRPCLEHDELAAVAPVGQRATDCWAALQELLDGALHEHIDAPVDGVVLEGADHLEPGAVADVGQPRIAVPAEVALEDETLWRP